ncbi:MAG: urease subunit beta [Nitrospira sp.]|nr:urease subunit beta [Nitrospira sp.]
MKKSAKRITAKAQPSVKIQAKASPQAPSRKAPQPADVIPGEIILGKGDIVALQGRRTVEVTVANEGDRPIQVGSHCHFFEANRSLKFDREKAFGFRLCVPAGTAVRFEPGEEKQVTLVALGGNRVAYGINGLTHGRLDDPQVKAQAMARAAGQGFLVKGSRP